MQAVADMEQDECDQWYQKHKDVCDTNYEGSSNAMELEGVESIWKRSVAELKLRFTTFIGDGDSKAFANLLVIKVTFWWWCSIEQAWKVHTGHIQKRMGTAEKAGAW